MSLVTDLHNGIGARRGFVLLSTAVSLIGLLALVGLALDIGRIYVARSELQVYADEAALFAAFELDGTPLGLTRARSAALTGPVAGNFRNRWNFSTQPVADLAPQFAREPEGPFDSNPVSAQGVRFIRVQASASVPLYFLPVVPGIAGSQHVSVVAVAGQNPRYSLGEGLAPFTPTAHNAADPNFGFQPGTLYTLRWAPSGQREKAGGSCAGDLGFDPGDASDRGYLDVGQGSGAAAVRATVIDASFFLPAPLQIGSAANMLSGQESVPDAIEQRFHQDSDVAATSYSEYNGNGRRILVVPVNQSGTPARIVGFAAFFLQPLPCGTKNTTPCCAEYIGSAVLSGNHKGAGAPGLFTVQLIQ